MKGRNKKGYNGIGRGERCGIKNRTQNLCVGTSHVRSERERWRFLHCAAAPLLYLWVTIWVGGRKKCFSLLFFFFFCRAAARRRINLKVTAWHIGLIVTGWTIVWPPCAQCRLKWQVWRVKKKGLRGFNCVAVCVQIEKETKVSMNYALDGVAVTLCQH